MHAGYYTGGNLKIRLKLANRQTDREQDRPKHVMIIQSGYIKRILILLRMFVLQFFLIPGKTGNTEISKLNYRGIKDHFARLIIFNLFNTFMTHFVHSKFILQCQKF